MLKGKPGPYILLIILLLALVFILGVRYGQKVEKTNKTINYLISLPPTKPPPTKIPLQFSVYKNDVCGTQFLYPASLKKEKEATLSVQFTEQNKIAVEFSCEKNSSIAALLEDKNIATVEIKLKNKKILAKNRDDDLSFKFVNPNNLKTIFATINISLFPLFESSLQYLNQ